MLQYWLVSVSMELRGESLLLLPWGRKVVDVRGKNLKT